MSDTERTAERFAYAAKIIFRDILDTRPGPSVFLIRGLSHQVKQQLYDLLLTAAWAVAAEAEEAKEPLGTDVLNIMFGYNKVKYPPGTWLSRLRESMISLFRGEPDEEGK